MAIERLTIADVNRLDRGAFVAALGHLYEGSPWIVAETWPARPFADRAALHRALTGTVAAAGEDRQLALIQAHPDLVGRAARAGRLTPPSAAEQAAAGLDVERLSADEVAAFERGNAAYRARFGFPFVICARENKKDAMLTGFTARLDHSRDEEIRVALREIARICWHRLAEAVSDDGPGVATPG